MLDPRAARKQLFALHTIVTAGAAVVHATIVEDVAESDETMELVVDGSKTEELESIDVEENDVDVGISEELLDENVAGAKELVTTVLEDRDKEVLEKIDEELEDNAAELDGEVCNTGLLELESV